MLASCKMVEKQSEAFYTFFLSVKQNLIACRSSNVSDCIFEIHRLWQSGFSRVYSTSCSSCSFKSEIIKIGQSMRYWIFKSLRQFSMPVQKSVWKLIEDTTYSSKYCKILPSTLELMIVCVKTEKLGLSRNFKQDTKESSLSAHFQTRVRFSSWYRTLTHLILLKIVKYFFLWKWSG